MSDGYNFFIGNVPITLPTNTGNSALQDADPVLYYLKSFVQNVLLINLGPRWNQEASAIGLTMPIVGDCNHFPPLQALTTTNYTFPLLSVYRTKEKYEAVFAGISRVNATFEITLVFEPLSNEQLAVLYPIITDVSRVLSNRIRWAYDPVYNPNTNLITEAGIELISLGRAEFGMVPGFQTDLSFPTVKFDFNIYERERDDLNNYIAFDGVELEVDGYSSPNDGYSPEPVILANFLQPPTLSIIAPNYGSSSGGTIVRITGSGFSSITSVIIGESNLTGITVADTIITGSTSTNIPGVADITLVDSKGNTYVFPNEFSYI